MKKVYKYIKFEQDEPGLKRWFCYNKKNDDWQMAEITYHSQWKQWVVEFRVAYIFNNTCLNDISHFLTQLNKPDSSPPKETDSTNSSAKDAVNHSSYAQANARNAPAGGSKNSTWVRTIEK